MTRYHRTWDRRGRLLRACLKLLGELNRANVKYGIDAAFVSQADAERLYTRLQRTTNRIKRELEHG